MSGKKAKPYDYDRAVISFTCVCCGAEWKPTRGATAAEPVVSVDRQSICHACAPYCLKALISLDRGIPLIAVLQTALEAQ